MEYLGFLDITGATQNQVSEEVFSSQIAPVIQDRQDIFSSFDAIQRHYSRFGLKGFSDAFIEAWDALVGAIATARDAAGGDEGLLKELLVDSLYRSRWAF